MGFDVCGLKPKTKSGSFFGATISYWTPLWDYVSATCSDLLTEEQIMQGYGNNGVRITARRADAVGLRLKKLLRSGETAEFIVSQKKRKQKPMSGALNNVRKLARSLGGQVEAASLDEDAVRKFANFCVASGGFEIH